VNVVGVAVSGGADSMALALLLHEWSHAHDIGQRMMAFCVDHQLRQVTPTSFTDFQLPASNYSIHFVRVHYMHICLQESSSELQQVTQWLQQRGLLFVVHFASLVPASS